MMTAEERRIDFYGNGDARAYDHDELYIMKEYAKDYHESEVKKFRLGAVIGSILAELEERKQWAENGMMVYSDDTNMRLEYQARIEEIENAIWTVNQYCR
jgi:hypothetical protein